MEYSNPYQSPSLNDLLSLKGKNALVIGGSGLLGGEMSYTLAELGANVIVASRDIDKCREFIKQMSKKFPGRHGAHSVDINSDESINALIKNTKDNFNGKLDILIFWVIKLFFITLIASSSVTLGNAVESESKYW